LSECNPFRRKKHGGYQEECQEPRAILKAGNSLESGTITAQGHASTSWMLFWYRCGTSGSSLGPCVVNCRTLVTVLHFNDAGLAMQADSAREGGGTHRAAATMAFCSRNATRGRTSFAQQAHQRNGSAVVSRAGPSFPFKFLQEETTAFSRLNFNGGSRAKGSEGRWRKFPVAISSRCRMRKG
jgi:hypothetical protein